MAQKIATKKLDLTAGTVTFSWSDGSSFIVKASEFPEKSATHLLLHGISQKIGDSYSGAESLAEAKSDAKGVFDNLMVGLWTEGRSSSGGILAEAVARLRNTSVEDVLATLADLSADDRAAVNKSPAVKEQIKIIRGERAQVKMKTLKEVKLPGFDE